MSVDPSWFHYGKANLETFEIFNREENQCHLIIEKMLVAENLVCLFMNE